MTIDNTGSAPGSPDPAGASTSVAEEGAVVTTTPANRVAGVVRVNLLPPELAEERVLRKVQLGGVAAVAVAAALVGLLWYQQSHKLSDAKDKLTAAQAQNARLRAEQARLGNVDALFKQVDQADAMLASAQAYEIHMSSYLDELSLRQPQDIWYNTVAITETPGGIPLAGTGAAAVVPGAAAAPAATGSLGTITVAGVGYKHNDVAAWMDSFAQMTGVTGVTLGSSVEALVGNQVPTVNWTTTAQLTLAALAPKDTTGSVTP